MAWRNHLLGHSTLNIVRKTCNASILSTIWLLKSLHFVLNLMRLFRFLSFPLLPLIGSLAISLNPGTDPEVTIYDENYRQLLQWFCQGLKRKEAVNRKS